MPCCQVSRTTTWAFISLLYPCQRGSWSPASEALMRVRPGKIITALTVMCLLSTMSAAHPLSSRVCSMRRLQRWFKCLKVDPIHQKGRQFLVSESVYSYLTYRENQAVISAKFTRGRVTLYVSVCMDCILPLSGKWSGANGFPPTNSTSTSWS